MSAEWPPKIPVAGICLLRTQDGRVLMLKPTYRPGWSLPGGAIDVGETPLEGALRELLEETGIRRTSGRLAVLDYRSAGREGLGWIRMVFDCGQLDESELSQITLQEAEIAEWQLMTPEDAVAAFEDPTSGPLLSLALESPTPVYAENGRAVSSQAG